MTLDDLRSLNMRDVGTWPMLPKIMALGLIFVAVIAIGAFFDWKDQFETLDKAQLEETKLRESYTSKKANAG